MHRQNCILLCIVVIVSVSLVTPIDSYQLSEWCDPRLCPESVSHIACNNTGEFAENCEPDAVMIDLNPLKEFILHEHNRRRNFIAAGKLPGYYPAARMATLVWDDELAYLATLNIKTCIVEHDDCHNSFRFRNVGQNLCGTDRRREHNTVEDIIQQALGLWFGEYPLIDSNYINEFRVASHFRKYGHFAQTVVDRNSHVGCAMMRYTNPLYPFLYIYNIGCNYGSTYAVGVQVYRTGKTASRCTTGTNPKYPSLCSIKETYNPNYNEYS